MRRIMLLAGAATAIALPAAAQDKNSDSGDRAPRADCPAPMQHTVRAFRFNSRDDTRAALGIGTTSGSVRDTLGLLVTDVTSGGPAEKAGIEEGDRLLSVNGTELRLAAADAGDQEMRGLMTRRLVRVLAKLKPGDVATLRVSSDGKAREVKITTVKASDLYRDDGLMRLGADWGGGSDMAPLDQVVERAQELALQNTERTETATKMQLKRLEEQLKHATSDLSGKLGKQLGEYRLELPDIDSDLELYVPPAPTAPTAPQAPSEPRRYMRIVAPAPPAAPAAPAAPVAPPMPGQSETSI
jgi:hypothetical protein